MLPTSEKFEQQELEIRGGEPVQVEKSDQEARPKIYPPREDSTAQKWEKHREFCYGRKKEKYITFYLKLTPTESLKQNTNMKTKWPLEPFYIQYLKYLKN